MVCTRDQTLTFADKKGVLGISSSYLKIKKSKICETNGVFTHKFIKKGTVITEYTGYKRKNKIAKKMKNKYKYEIDDNWSLIGIVNIKKLSRKGVAHLCNDAISKTLTYQENNCDFYESSGKVFIKARRDIQPNEELLVSYGIDYWIDEISNYSNLYSNAYSYWIKIISNIVRVCNNWLKSKKNFVYEIIDWNSDEDILYLNLENNKHICPYDDKENHPHHRAMTLKLKRYRNFCAVIYVCKICNKNNMFIGKFNTNEFTPCEG